jgi:hypothetical protein
MKANTFDLWTLYDHPRDYPDMFVARKFVISEMGARPTNEVIVHKSLHPLRILMQAKGLSCLQRMPADEPQIIEAWF